MSTMGMDVLTGEREHHVPLFTLSRMRLFSLSHPAGEEVDWEVLSSFLNLRMGKTNDPDLEDHSTSHSVGMRSLSLLSER